MKIDFEQPYAFKDMATVTAEALTKARTHVTYELIMSAASQVYDKGMTKKEGRVFRTFTDAIAINASSVDVSSLEWKMLYDMFCSKRAEGILRFAPTGASWVSTWCEYLEKIHQDNKDGER